MMADRNKTAIKTLVQNAPHPLHYGITKTGKSTLRNLTSEEVAYLRLSSSSSSSKILAPVLTLLLQKDIDNSKDALDKAHEMILGVNETNIAEAEYAATYRNTSWSDDHPLDTDQDMLHSILHRLEGRFIGEGGHTGYDNAKYWLFGGSKMLDAVDENHAVRVRFKEYVLRNYNYLREMGLIVEEEEERRSYEIIAGNNRTRKIFLRKGEFDWIRFYDLCEMSQEKYSTGGEKVRIWEKEWVEYIVELQVVEIDLIVQYAVTGELR